MEQKQFLNVIDRDQAEERFRDALNLRAIGTEVVRLQDCLHRVLAEDMIAEVNVPSFDRSNFDGFAVRSQDTIGADDENPTRLRIVGSGIPTATIPTEEVRPGTAIPIVTGAMIPRGCNAIMLIEHTEPEGDDVLITRSVAAGFGISFAGSDIPCGETVLRQGTELSSRETGLIAAIGQVSVPVFRRPLVAVISTGDEIVPPGEAMRPGLVYDSNATVLCDAIRELGAQPRFLGTVHDNLDQLRHIIEKALTECDAVLLSGGTSKGAGDLSYQVVREYENPGIVAHGVALKPGKPICLAADRGKPLVVLPGFPTSAVFTFHEFVAPVLRILAGKTPQNRQRCEARLASRVNSQVGRTEYLLVGLIAQPESGESNSSSHRYTAFPMGKGSGSVTTFSRADGFITIPRHTEFFEAGEKLPVQLLGSHEASDLVVIGSHCVGLDTLLGELQREGFTTKLMAVGSSAGLDALGRGECDLAGIHLMDATGEYNRSFLDDSMRLIPGYRRRQGLIYRLPRGVSNESDKQLSHKIDALKGKASQQVVTEIAAGPWRMVNRNRGAGTRVLIDQWLEQQRPPGYEVQVSSHHAVAAAIQQGRADWGVAIDGVVRSPELGFLHLCDEHFDFACQQSGWDSPVIQAFRRILDDENTHRLLGEKGLIK